MREILEPRSVEEASAMMKRAAEQGAQVRFSAVHLNAIDEYEPADLVISAQAGVTMRQLADATKPHNQFLALDPAIADDGLLGDVVERGAAGPLRFGHGTPRDQVLGLEVVAGDGRILKFGGKVVKNVAGYDVVRLLVGSRGTLGFITRVNVRLKPIPAVDRTAIFATDTFAHAADIADAVRGSRLDAVALEVVSPPFMPAWCVIVRLHGNEESVADGIERLPGAPSEITHGDAVWQQLRRQEAAAAVSIRIAHLPSKLRDTMEIAEQVRPGIANPSVAIHAGDGIVRLLGSAFDAKSVEVLHHARDVMVAEGGSLLVERMQPRIDMAAFGLPGAIEIMRQIKRVFDPAGILGAGSMAL